MGQLRDDNQTWRNNVSEKNGSDQSGNVGAKKGATQAKVGKKELARLMKKIDFCMMTTVAEDGELHSRPMSNNDEVEWDGDTWFFAQNDSSQVEQISRNPQVNLAYALPRRMVFISVQGKARIVQDPVKKKELWRPMLRMWFPDGPEDDKLVLICVEGEKAVYWGKDGEAYVELKQPELQGIR
jgi:general stress protein 26